jgi:hypothetical protein
MNQAAPSEPRRGFVKRDQQNNFVPRRKSNYKPRTKIILAENEIALDSMFGEKGINSYIGLIADRLQAEQKKNNLSPIIILRGEGRDIRMIADAVEILKRSSGLTFQLQLPVYSTHSEELVINGTEKRIKRHSIMQQPLQFTLVKPA